MSALRTRKANGAAGCFFGLLWLALSAGGANAQNQAVPSSASSASPPRTALVIGNSSYRVLPALANPANDARDMCAALERLNFTVFCARNVASRRALRELVQNFSAKLRPNSLALFYYAGHGVQVRGENYLLPADIDVRSTADIEDEALGLSYVLRTLEEARSAPNVVILDACRDNPFSRSNSLGLARGLARFEPPLGTILAYATAPNSVAIDGNEKNGLFTKHLLLNLSKPGLKLEELLQIVAKSVEEEAKSVYRMEQIPFRSSSFAGNYCLAGCETPQFLEKLEQITRQSDEATRRMKELSEENANLRTQAKERADKISALETRIGQLGEAATRSGSQGKEAEEELRRLHRELDTVRQRQYERDKDEQKESAYKKELAELRNRLAALQKQAGELDEAKRQLASAKQATAGSAKDLELAELRSKLTVLQAQAQQLDDYRRQIEQLQRDNEAKAKLLAERQKGPESPPVRSVPRTVVVPSF
jgi:hypothetical protein